MSQIVIDLHHTSDVPSGRYITQVRATKADKELMREAAKLIGMPLGTFLRTVGVKAAWHVINEPYNTQL